MKERPIIFSSVMIRALLSGRKTQTRRTVKGRHLRLIQDSDGAGNRMSLIDKNPYGQSGDRLWVKETWRTMEYLDSCRPSLLPSDIPVDYKADLGEPCMNGMSKKWRSSLFMPKHLSRITLEIVDLRIEKLTECSEIDAELEGVEIKEGADNSNHSTYKASYKEIWESINGVGSWADDPLVWVLDFERVS